MKLVLASLLLAGCVKVPPHRADAMRLIDGTLVLYYGQFDHLIGGTINVAACPDPTPVAAGMVPALRRR